MKLVTQLLFLEKEGLQEASEVLERMVEYYSEPQSDLGQATSSEELGLLTGKVLPSEVRPPLVLDFDQNPDTNSLD